LRQWRRSDFDERGLVEHCKFYNNVGNGGYNGNVGGGGAIKASGGTIRNCEFSGNRVSVGGHGGAIYLVGGSPVVESCTIVSNALTATGYDGGGIYRASGAVTNTIAYFNAVSGVHSNVAGTLANFVHCCAPELSSGAGNITADPAFTDLALADYRPRFTSPCINAGTNQLWMINAMDLAGQPRLLDRIVDIGAYEMPAAAKGTVFTVR